MSKETDKKAKKLTALIVFGLFFFIILWGGISSNKNPQTSNSPAGNAGDFIPKKSLKLEVSPVEDMGSRKSRLTIKASGFKNISKIDLSIKCIDAAESTSSSSLGNCGKVETINIDSGKTEAEKTIVFYDYDFKNDTGNKIEVIGSNYTLAGIPRDDERVLSNGSEEYYSGKVEFTVNKTIPTNKAILKGGTDNYSRISVGMTLAEIEEFYAMSKVCEKYAESESQFGSSVSYKCSLGGEYAHFSFSNGKLSSKIILKY